MRYLIMSVFITVFGLSGVHAEQTPGAEASHAAPAIDAQSLKAAEDAYGVREETPNEKRIRLGQPIVASFPPPDYGEALETPNQQRARLAAEREAKETKPEPSAAHSMVSSLR